ncbi:MAG: hypothetical protein Q8L43_03220, partial [Deltaproteobacteria bacterium]|nr:hypothetical protein [Deltaproteobacteria bacterium]
DNPAWPGTTPRQKSWSDFNGLGEIICFCGACQPECGKLFAFGLDYSHIKTTCNCFIVGFPFISLNVLR